MFATDLTDLDHGDPQSCNLQLRDLVACCCAWAPISHADEDGAWFCRNRMILPLRLERILHGQ